MSDTPEQPEPSLLKETVDGLRAGAPITPLVEAIAYTKGKFFPPLPDAYAPWLVHLAELAAEQRDPGTVVPIPDAVKDSGFKLPRGTRTEEDGTLVITLGDALAALRQTDLLYPEPDEDENYDEGDEDLCIVTPVVALAMANTADAASWDSTYDLMKVEELAAKLTSGEWTIDRDNPVRVDRQARVVAGLNELLAITRANVVDAPLYVIYEYDNETTPLTWRGPADQKGPISRD